MVVTIRDKKEQESLKSLNNKIFHEVIICLNEYIDGIDEIISKKDISEKTRRKLRKFYIKYINKIKERYRKQ